MKREKRKTCTTAHFLAIMECLTEESVESVKGAKRVSTFKGKPLKTDINGIMCGELLQLMEIKTISEEFIKPMQIVEGLTEEEVLKADVSVTAGYRNWIIDEVKRVSKMFEALGETMSYSSEEIAAGVTSLNFGTFGIVDSYAKRMGIIDHDYVLQCVPWVVIYQCMKMDNEVVAYQRRLKKLIYKKK